MQGSGMDLLYQTVFKTAILLLRVCRRIPIVMRTTEKVFKGSEIYEMKGHRSKVDIFKGK